MKKPISFYFCVLLLPGSLDAQQNESNLFLSRQQTLEERWELNAKSHKGVFVITPYKPVFVTAGRRSDKPNIRPYSENAVYSQPTDINYNNYEARFQFSLKSKMIYGMFKGRADLWVGYTQKAHWQIYNSKLSRPFRELNYEPEVILNFPVKVNMGGLALRMFGFSFNHQSNGRSLPLSRSWNRVVAHVGLEAKNVIFLLKGWYRLPDEEDENPMIADYIGRGEGVFIYNIQRHQISAVVTSALRPSYPGRGSLNVNYSLPLINNFRLQAQFSTGYGETLVDYNHAQTTFGISVSLIEW
jgi:phospholipase A1/A2